MDQIGLKSSENYLSMLALMACATMSQCFVYILKTLAWYKSKASPNLPALVTPLMTKLGPVVSFLQDFQFNVSSNWISVDFPHLP